MSDFSKVLDLVQAGLLLYIAVRMALRDKRELQRRRDALEVERWRHVFERDLDGDRQEAARAKPRYVGPDTLELHVEVLPDDQRGAK